jgi:hypothetical protein
MIATRFTADQLVLSPANAGSGKAAEKCIEICKLLQHVYPDARFAVDGRSRSPSNEVDYRGRIDVYPSIDGEWVGRIDVDYTGWNTNCRLQFEGPFVDKGEARYHGNGKVWRKDAIKLVQAIQAQNCLRGKNPVEVYQEAKAGLEASARRRLANLEEHAGKLLRLAKDEALSLALGGKPSAELAGLAEAAKLHWKDIVTKVQEDLDRQNRELAAQHGVTPHAVGCLHVWTGLGKVLEAL